MLRWERSRATRTTNVPFGRDLHQIHPLSSSPRRPGAPLGFGQSATAVAGENPNPFGFGGCCCSSPLSPPSPHYSQRQLHHLHQRCCRTSLHFSAPFSWPPLLAIDPVPSTLPATGSLQACAGPLHPASTELTTRRQSVRRPLLTPSSHHFRLGSRIQRRRRLARPRGPNIRNLSRSTSFEREEVVSAATPDPSYPRLHPRWQLPPAIRDLRLHHPP